MSLQGKNVVITRQQEGSAELVSLLETCGAKVASFPFISFSYRLPEFLHDHAKTWDENTWVIITSQNALSTLQNVSNEKTQSYKIATVGSKTKAAIEKLGYKVSFVPTKYTAKCLIKELSTIIKDEKVVYLRGNLAKEAPFSKAFSNYVSFVVYETHVNKENAKAMHRYAKKNKVDYFVFTSPSAVFSFFEEIKECTYNSKFVAIGPSTKTAIEQYGVTNIIMPEVYTIEGMVKEMEENGL